MDGQMAQVAALVAGGNAWLAGDREAGARVERGSTLQYVRSIRFQREVGQPPTPTTVDGDVASWFGRFDGWGVTALWLDPRPLAIPTFPAHVLAAFANASRASIVAEGHERVRWISTWTVDRAPTATDKRIWTIESIGHDDIADLAPRPSIAAAHASLQASVEAARDLARRYDWAMWTEWFARAFAAGASDEPHARFHDDVLPPGAKLDRRRLFALAAGAWVFGGMGSWNDIGPPDKEAEADYQGITETLYAAVLDAVAAAVNPRA
jgi:hypothetical protein